MGIEQRVHPHQRRMVTRRQHPRFGHESFQAALHGGIQRPAARVAVGPINTTHAAGQRIFLDGHWHAARQVMGQVDEAARATRDDGLYLERGNARTSGQSVNSGNGAESQKEDATKTAA